MRRGTTNISLERSLLETVGVLALFDVRDHWHAAAEAAWAKVLADEADFLTPALVLVECANAAAPTAWRRW